MDNAAAAFGKLIARIASLKPENGPVEEEILAQSREKFTQQVGNDLNTSMGITALYDGLKAKANDATKLAILDSFDQVLSLSLVEKAAQKRRELEAEAKAKALRPNRRTLSPRRYCHRRGEADPEIEALARARGRPKARTFKGPTPSGIN